MKYRNSLRMCSGVINRECGVQHQLRYDRVNSVFHLLLSILNLRTPFLFLVYKIKQANIL